MLHLLLAMSAKFFAAIPKGPFAVLSVVFKDMQRFFNVVTSMLGGDTNPEEANCMPKLALCSLESIILTVIPALVTGVLVAEGAAFNATDSSEP